jgi:hypothetical protein
MMLNCQTVHLSQWFALKWLLIRKRKKHKI